MLQPRIPYDVTLSRGHLDQCRAEVENRAKNAGSMKARGNNYDEEKFSQREADFVGAMGELATSFFTGLRHHFGEPYRANVADVGLIEVRTRTLGKTPILRIYESDPHPITLLATIRQLSDDGAVVRLHGWCFTQIGWSYGKQVGKHWKKGVQYALDETFLRPMDTLSREHQLAERFYQS